MALEFMKFLVQVENIALQQVLKTHQLVAWCIKETQQAGGQSYSTVYGSAQESHIILSKPQSSALQ